MPEGHPIQLEADQQQQHPVPLIDLDLLKILPVGHWTGSGSITFICHPYFTNAAEYGMTFPAGRLAAQLFL